MSARAPTDRDAVTPPADVHSPPHPSFYDREMLPIRTRRGLARMVRVKETNSIVALLDAVGEALQQHTTTTYCQYAECCDWRWTKGRATHTTTFFALPRYQPMSMTPPAHNFTECKRHASVRRGIDFKFCVDGRRFVIITSALVS